MGCPLPKALSATLLLLSAGCIASSTLAGKSSGLIGCRTNEIEIKDQSVDGLVRTWVASCRGRDYQCNITGEGGDTACAPLDGPKQEAKRAPVPSTPTDSEPPRGAGGFVFGVPLADAEKACRDAGHEWAPGSAEQAHTCSGTITPMELPARVELLFRADKLTAATLVVTSPRSPVDVFGKLGGVLRAKYGDPKSAKDDTPAACEKSVPECLNDGRMTALRGWTWKSGEAILLSVGPRDGAKTPVVTARYDRDTATDGL